MKNTLLKGEATPFVMELPPYHLPTIKGVLTRTWDRTKSFIFRAGKIIVPMVLVLNVLNSIGTDGSFGNEDSDQSLLSEVGRGIAPAFSPMGLDEENWPAAVGIFTGILAKEAVVGTLDSMYTFILLYFPCTAALAAVYREINMGWTLFVAGWTTGIGYVAGTIFYQGATFARHPETSVAWIVGMLALFSVTILTLRQWGIRERQRSFDADALRGMLVVLERKGRVRKLPVTACGGCNQCDQAGMELSARSRH